MINISLIHDFKNHICKTEIVDFIVPERLVEARKVRGMTQEEAAEKLEIARPLLGLMENGHHTISAEFIFRLMTVYSLPKGFFYKVKWERV